MVADLVDQHVAHDMREVLAGLAPIVEDRPAVEEDHVELRLRRERALVRDRDAAIEAEYVERALELHLLLGLLVRKLLDADDDVVDVALQLGRDRLERDAREALE